MTDVEPLGNDQHVIKCCHDVGNIFCANNYYGPAIVLLTRRNNNRCGHHVTNNSVLNTAGDSVHV